VRGTSDMVELGWRLGFGLRQNWHVETWGRCTQAYIGAWEEFKRIKIRIRHKIQV
jgi:hypothetical protein